MNPREPAPAGAASNFFHAATDTLIQEISLSNLFSFAVLTISFVAPVGAARAVLGLVMGQLSRRRPKQQ